MTPQQAIEILKSRANDYANGHDLEFRAAVELAVKSIEENMKPTILPD